MIVQADAGLCRPGRYTQASDIYRPAGPFRNTEYSRWLELKRDSTSLGTYGTTRSETRYC